LKYYQITLPSRNDWHEIVLSEWIRSTFSWICERSVFFSSDPLKVQSQTWYLLMCDNIVLLRRFVKKAIYTTSSNYFEILTIHQASCECTWPRSVI